MEANQNRNKRGGLMKKREVGLHFSLMIFTLGIMRVGTGRNIVTQCGGCRWDRQVETPGGAGSPYYALL